MKILFFSHYFPPEVNAPASRTYEHCKLWAEAGNDITVITCNPNCPSGKIYDGYKNKLIQKEVIDGIKVIRLWTFLAPNKGTNRRMLNYMSYLIVTTIYTTLFMRKIDVLIATSPQFLCGWAGVLCHWIRRWSFILEIRDIWPESILSVDIYKKSFFIKCMEWLEPKMYRAADHIVAVGEGYKRKIMEKGIDASKISVITNGINIDNFFRVENVDAIKRKYNSEKSFICSYVGTIGLAHGLEVIIKAAEILKENGYKQFKFWIVGDGANKSSLESMAKDKKLDNVVFTGMLPKKNIPEILSATDCLLIHLKGKELFSTVIPSKIFEAMAMNKPIIMGVKGDSRDIVMEANAGIEMEPDNPTSLVQCLVKLYETGEMPDSREYVDKIFSRKNLADKMLKKIYETAGK